MGLLWIGLEPLFIFVILFVVFNTIRIRGGGEEFFAIYLLTGITMFHIFTRGTMSGLGSLRQNRNILESINIKREFFPVSTVLLASISAVIEISVLVALMPIFGFVPELSVILLPIPVILVLILTLGVSYILSIINVYARDIQLIWIVISQILFFVSPIFWKVKEIDGFLLEIHNYNPIGQIIDLTHKIIFNELESITEIIYPTIFVLVIFFVGFAIFQKFEERVLEKL